jgi:ABC-type phosphate/phosphonate transport system substrate-binding protein
MRGEADAAGVKDLRLQAVLAANPAWRVRVLATSGPVPENTLVVRADVAGTAGRQLAEALTQMGQTAEGQAALKEYGAQRFIPCSTQEFGVIYDIVEKIGAAWPQLGIDGPAPRRPVETK